MLAAPPAPVFIPFRGPNPDATTIGIPHQPLVQIKLRVVEVTRENDLSVASTLDYIRNRRGIESDFKGRGVPNVNNSQQNLTGVSRFSVPGLIDVPGEATMITSTVPTGAGALVNLTSEHLNWIARILAEDLNADILTAPELVCTNGERVEFVAGSKSPFALGTVQTVSGPVQDNLFYKHVGTYISVQPRIVNFGRYGLGKGDAMIVATDVRDWDELIHFVLRAQLLDVVDAAKIHPPIKTIKDGRKHYLDTLKQLADGGKLIPMELQTEMLEVLNNFSKSDLQQLALERGLNAGINFQSPDSPCDCQGNGCNWSPEDCTIDLDVLARFSNKGSEAALPGRTNLGTDGLDAESDVRAIANTIQIKSGTGLVMAGLLSESDIQGISKVPVLGDLPAVGVLFRSKSVSRAKTEILIFIEARVLSSDPSIARAESAQDLQLAGPYVSGGTLDNPLELGLHRAGFAAYLPPPTCDESEFWNLNGSRVNKIKTTAYDAFR